MRRDRVLRFLLWSLIACSLVLFVFYYLTLTLYYGSFVWFGYFFPGEARVQEIADLSAENPRVALPDLLDEEWDYACFLAPYYDHKTDPFLTDVEVPWTIDDSALTVVLGREKTYDLHKIDRTEIVEFRLEGLPEGEVCYDSTDVVLEYVEGDNPTTLRVTPMR